MDILPVVFDLGAVRQRGMNRAVAVAGHVDRLIDTLFVVLAVPAGQESDLDLFERPRPFLVLLALDLDGQRLEGLLELLEQQDGVQARAAAERSEQHLGRAHRLVVAEDGRLVDARAVAGGRFDVELDLVAGPGSRRLCHTRTIAACRGMEPRYGRHTPDDTYRGVATPAGPVKTAATPRTSTD